jgi:hypothetical protein
VTELAYLGTRNIGQFPEQRRNKLQDAVSGIPPADQQREIAAALELDRDRRLELKSKIDELSTDEIERLLSFSTPRVSSAKLARIGNFRNLQPQHRDRLELASLRGAGRGVRPVARVPTTGTRKESHSRHTNSVCATKAEGLTPSYLAPQASARGGAAVHTGRGAAVDQ